MATEKRSIGKDSLHYNVSAIIVDIEGTTTSINFVKETLFPYVREHLNEYVESNWDDKTFQDDVSLLREQATKDLEEKLDGAVEIPAGDGDNIKKSVINNVLWQMDNDRKTKALKQLQGHIWKSGYSSGKIVGHIYDEVKECLQAWTESGKKVYVYSSGSVEAQKLLFGSTKEGDILSVFSGYFDTTVGAKTEASSYNKILEQLKESGHISGPKDALFLTDVPNEAKAAVEAGLEAVIVVREGNAPLPEDVKETFPVINSFCDLIFEGNIKRRKLSNEKLVESNDNNEGSKVNGEEKDMEMDVCPSENDTTETVVNGKSEESVEGVKVAEDSVENSKTESKKSVEEVKKDESVENSGDLVKKNDSDKKNSDTVEKMEESVEITKPETESEAIKENGDKSKCVETTEEVGEAKVTEEEEKVEKVVEATPVVVEPETKQIEKNDVLNSESGKIADVKEDVEEKKSEETAETAEKTTNGEVETSDKSSEKKSNSEEKADTKALNEKTNGEVNLDEKVKETVEKRKESHNGEVETIADDKKSADNDSEPDKSVKNEDDSSKTDNKKKDVEKTEDEDSQMQVDKKVDNGKANQTDKEKLDSKDSGKFENGDPTKETDDLKTDATIKTNGTHKEVLKNGVSEDKKETAIEEKTIKEKVMGDDGEQNGVEVAEKV